MSDTARASWALTWVCPECGRRGFHLGNQQTVDPDVLVAAADELDADPSDLLSVPAVVHCLACEARIELDMSDV